MSARTPLPPVVDAHHHVWRQADLPWLLGPERPRIFGAYAPIKRDVTLAEFRAAAEPAGVVKSVYVQANWAPNWAADEAAWVQSLTDAEGWPHAIVAYADMTARDVRPALDRLAAFPAVRGIRQQLHWHDKPAYRFAARADLCDDPALHANAARLAERGWSFDLQVFAPQMAGAAGLAKACPDTTFVLQHAGMLEDLSEPGRAAWREGMARLADRPNVVAKLSALGTFVRRNDPSLVAEIVGETVALFGPERCLWGSNFPIETMWADYADVLAAHDAATADLGPEARRAIFHDTACRVYRLEP